MNNTTYYPSNSGDDSRRFASSTAPASVESLQAKISSLDMLRVRMASECSFPSTGLYKAKDTTATDAEADSIKGSDMDMRTLHIPTKNENYAPGPTLNPVSCASGHALISSGGAPSVLSKSTTVADVRQGSNMDVQILRIPTKSESSEPGPILNPASCASGLALFGGDFRGGEGDGLISDLSLTALIERIHGHQGNTQRQNQSHQNEDWGDLQYTQAQGNLFLGNGDI